MKRATGAQLIDGVAHWPIFVRRRPSDPWKQTDRMIRLCPTDSADKHHWERLRDLRKASGLGDRSMWVEKLVMPTGVRPTLADLAWGLTLEAGG